MALNIFETVKENITARQVAEFYGAKVSRNGMCRCPFHNDNNPSMKVKREFYYCLGCGATGNWWTLKKLGVVDFDYIRVGKVKS